MAKTNNTRKKRFYNANRKRMQRIFYKEKDKINQSIFNVKNNIQSPPESLNVSNNIARDTEAGESIFHHELREWALKYNIRAYCLRDLLKMLTKVGIPFLSKDPSTFLRTPKSIDIENIANGQFWYNGITDHLARTFKTMDTHRDVELNFHVDGLQLFNSSSKQFWPILAQIHGW